MSAQELEAIAKGKISLENLKLVTSAWRLLTKERFDWLEPDQRFRTISYLDWQRIEHVLERQCEPCSHNEAVAAMTLLIGSFPFVQVPDLQIYTSQLVKYAETFPRDVLEQAVDALVRTCARAPSPAQLIEACDEKMAERAMALSRAARMVKLLKSELRSKLKAV